MRRRRGSARCRSAMAPIVPPGKGEILGGPRDGFDSPPKPRDKKSRDRVISCRDRRVRGTPLWWAIRRVLKAPSRRSSSILRGEADNTPLGDLDVLARGVDASGNDRGV